MLTLPALKVQQFAQEFYLLNLAAGDVERLVRFEVLGESGVHGSKPKRRTSKASPVNWEQIEKQVQTSEKAYQRPILRKKIDELAKYYLQCREDGAVPAIPGAVLLTSEEPVEFEAEASNPFVGLLKLPGDDDALRVLDGQHRLLALAALLRSPDVDEADRAAARTLQVPAVFFVGLPAPSIVEMFVTINSKHTRLNSSLLFSLKGRQLYADPMDARIHDTLQKLNVASSSPLAEQIKMLGVGKGKVAQSSLAQEFRKTVKSLSSEHGEAPWFGDFVEHLPRFYLAYFKQVARVFEDVWTSKQYSVRSPTALRAFIQASEPVVVRVMRAGGDPRATLRTALGPWKERIGNERFRTEGLFKERASGGSRNAIRTLAGELIEALEDPS